MSEEAKEELKRAMEEADLQALSDAELGDVAGGDTCENGCLPGCVPGGVTG